jgi:preprotein translocase subunit YajC
MKNYFIFLCILIILCFSLIRGTKNDRYFVKLRQKGSNEIILTLYNNDKVIQSSQLMGIYGRISEFDYQIELIENSLITIRVGQGNIGYHYILPRK